MKRNTKYTDKQIKTFSNFARDEDDDLDITETEKFCAYETRTRALRQMTVPLDGPIRESAFYRMVASEAQDLSENDELRFHIDSPGGDFDGLVALLNIINTTDASVTAFLNGKAHSAASILAVSCPNVFVSQYTTMLVHYVSYGVPRSKGQDVRSYVDHTSQITENVFREIYTGFLTEEEMDSVLKGQEMWLNSDQIVERLEALDKYRQSLMQVEGVEEESLEE